VILPARPVDTRDAATARVESSASPLWLLTDEPLVNELVGYLETMRRRITADPHGAHEFSFSRAHLIEVRAAFARMIRRGEEKLHRLCELLCESYFDSPYSLQNVVIGEVETTLERFTLVQPLVSTDLQFLVRHPDVKVVIEGHCDERGSDEYNMGLGESRASTVKDALVKGGVGADRIKIVSFGKERPFCATENEPCYRQNRRAHFVFKSQQQASNN